MKRLWIGLLAVVCFSTAAQAVPFTQHFAQDANDIVDLWHVFQNRTPIAAVGPVDVIPEPTPSPGVAVPGADHYRVDLNGNFATGDIIEMDACNFNAVLGAQQCSMLSNAVTVAPTVTDTPSRTATNTQTSTATQTVTATQTATLTQTATMTQTATLTQTATTAPTNTHPPLATRTSTNSPVPTNTNSPIPPTATNSPVPPTATNSPIPATPTRTPFPTPHPPVLR